jgi:hypothetical protein
MRILIVGAGIAGLHCALRLKGHEITIAEASSIGGRIDTHYADPGKHNGQWEKGAGRISEDHPGVKKYIKRYGLTPIPINSEEVWINDGSGMKGQGQGQEQEANIFPISVICDGLESLSPETLATNTIRSIIGNEDLLLHFPYRSELDILRADLAIQSFRGEMSSTSNFFVVAEGLSAVVKGMKEELVKRGVRFMDSHRLLDIRGTKCLFYSSPNVFTIDADKVILAIDSESLKLLPTFSKHPILKHLTMPPLLRVYATFKNWFPTSKIVTDSPLRYIIPIDKKRGIVMFYTEGSDVSDKATILSEFRRQGIPKPLTFHYYKWDHGTTYWLPGTYDPLKESRAIMNPYPNVYVCGESYSMRQAWVEGALEHADEMLEKFLLHL